MKKPLIAIPSFPGSNGEVDNLRVLKRCGFDCFVFRWNDSLEKLQGVDGYFFGAGFSYEDRGRSGMVAARDPLFSFMRDEAEKGKVIIGNCNGAQVLIESGLIPLGDGLRLCLAHNAIRAKDGTSTATGFLSEWVWITPTCKRDRCATSNWSGTLHIPIAHGEGRFVTRDPDLIQELQKDDQIAFQYSNAQGTVSPDTPVTPNGSMLGIAGICNRAGNVVCLMPHPERTTNGDPYFLSVRRWIEERLSVERSIPQPLSPSDRIRAGTFHFPPSTPQRAPMPIELFIDTIITNNEERTVEQAVRRIEPSIRLKQYRYVGLRSDRTVELLSSFSFFNPHKDIAYVRQHGEMRKWDARRKSLEPTSKDILAGISLLRRDEPDVLALSIGTGAETGVCYDCRDVTEEKLLKKEVCEVFCNPHASTLERIVPL